MQDDRLLTFGGEFRDRAREQAFRAERFGEAWRQARLLLAVSAILNALFLASDWRFHGDPHFYVAVPARLAEVALSLACLAAVWRARDVVALQRALLVWMAGSALAVGALVSSQSDIALFVVMMLPAIFYLVVPVAFRWTLACGIACSAAMLAGYFWEGSDRSTVLGMCLVVLMLNAALTLVVVKSNRMARIAWAATEAERRAKEELAASQRQFQELFATAPVPLVVTAKADGAVLQFNEAAGRFFGAEPGRIEPAGIAAVYEDPARRAILLRALEARGRVEGFELRIRAADGSVRDVLLSAVATRFGETDSIMAGVVDITERKALETRLKALATTDPLTGLANRARYFGVAERQVRSAARSGRSLGVLMIDIDRFKAINDTHGHQVGDRALRRCADALRHGLGDRNLLARLGGEEFAALLPDCGLAEAAGLAEALRAAVAGLEFEDGGLRITVSIGVAELHAGEADIAHAMTRADRALYDAKEAGRDRVAVSSPPPAAREVA